MADDNSDNEAARPSAFPSTPWTLLVAAKGDDTVAHDALSDLCRMYWFPIYAYARRSGHSPPDAEDLTQGYFAQLFRRDSLKRVDKEKGKLRSFLLGGLKFYIVEEWRKSQTAKRGGGAASVSIDQEEAEQRYHELPADHETPDKVFERQWAMTVLHNTLAQLGGEYEARGKSELFTVLRPCLTPSGAETPMAELSAQTGLSEGNVRITIHRLRKRYRDLLKQFVRATVGAPEEVDAEIQGLFQALS